MTLRKSTDRHDSLLRELHEERAAALLRVTRRLEQLLERLTQAQRDLPPPDAGDARSQAVAAYAELRQQAKQYRWYLEVQREAIGLRRHQILDEFYPIPPAIDR